MQRMTLERFRALADAWGGDLARWPHQARGHARALLASDDAAPARAILQQAAALDAVLAHRADPPSPTLAQRILAVAPAAASAASPRGRLQGWRHAAHTGRAWLRELGGARVVGPALAAALVLGVALAGLRGEAMAPDGEQDTLLSAALLAGDYEEFTQ